jgi:hypothetical protein
MALQVRYLVLVFIPICVSGLEIAGCQWPKAGHILEMAGKNKFELPK